MTGISDLPIEVVSQIVFEAQGYDDDGPFSRTDMLEDEKSACITPIRALSETTHALRVLALPHLWHNISIFIDCGQVADAIRCLKGFTRHRHPAHEHARC